MDSDKNAKRSAAPGSAGVPAGPSKSSKSQPPPPNLAGEDPTPPPPPQKHKGWYSRGYLPHFDGADLIQSITFRLADSIPKEKLLALEKELQSLPQNQRSKQKRIRIEAYLDSGMGCCALRHPEVAAYVSDSLSHFHGTRYHLYAWCVMPNHVHLVVKPIFPLEKIIHGWKSFTSHWIVKQNERLDLKIPDPHQLWQREYRDRYIRDQNHYETAVAYLHPNPVKAGLCDTPKTWPWSSASGS